jgi:superfamily I DNA/RNA helicase
MNQAPSPCGHRLPLSDEQLAVLECCLSGGLVVVSKAGTGKTRTAAALACLGLAVGQRILLLSFTRNGVKELARKLALQHGLVLSWTTESSLRGPRIAVRTFDSLLAWALATIGVEEARRERAGLRWQITELTRIGKAELYHAGQDAGLWTPHNYHFRLRDICDLLARRQSLSHHARAVVDRWWPALRENAERKRLILPADYDRLVIANAREIAVLLEQTCELVVVDEHQDSSERDVAPLIEAARRGQLTQAHFGDPGQ